MRRVVIAGASGLLGTALSRTLTASGAEVTRLVRGPAGASEVSWTPGIRLDPAVVAGADAVVVLNGASIGRLPWTASYRETLVRSRIVPMRTIAAALRELGTEAPALIAASATGYYGSARGATLDESSAQGSTFLADLCGEWERAAHVPNSRVVHARIAPVVHPEGVLKPLMLLTRFGVSGPIAGGRQVWPWIGYTDVVRALSFLLDSAVDGPVNLAGPTRATANDLGFALAVAMNRPYLIPAPGWALRLALGADAADGLLLSDAHVVPRVLEESGFAFHTPTVTDAVAEALALG